LDGLLVQAGSEEQQKSEVGEIVLVGVLNEAVLQQVAVQVVLLQIFLHQVAGFGAEKLHHFISVRESTAVYREGRNLLVKLTF